MAVYGRFLVNGQPSYGQVESGIVYFLEDLFSGAKRTGESATLDGLKILAPVEPKKLFAIGLNYVDHAQESGKPVPDVPLMWFKAPSAIIAHNEAVTIAYPEHNTDYEGELTVVIGKKCKGATEANALDFVFGYTIGQDISDRHIQHSESQWARAKSFDTYAPLGPFIHTDLDSTNLSVETRVNGELRQSSNTNQLVFGVAKLIAFLSEAITLEPGDCIMTGTPFGVGPLKSGDVIETRIGPMGPLINPVA